MATNNSSPTTDELFELLKRTSIPTVLVEGKNDIIFYRAIEDELRDIGIDMLPAGNKNSVLNLRERLIDQKLNVPISFIVDKDIWIHTGVPSAIYTDNLIVTNGYSIENDLISDGKLIDMMTLSEKCCFEVEVKRFLKWYALSVHRHLRDSSTLFRIHPGKLLDDDSFYEKSLELHDGEEYPEELLEKITTDYECIMRGKSLFAILHRQLSRKNRAIKYSERQLMGFGASRKGENFQRIKNLVRESVQKSSSYRKST